MKQLFITACLISFSLFSFAQEKKVSVKKEKLYINDSTICIIDKKKKGMLSIPSFELRGLEEKPLGFVGYKSMHSPLKGLISWYNFAFEGIQDSVQLIDADFNAYDKSMFTKYDEAIGKIIAKYDLVQNGQINAAGVAAFKKDYAVDYTTKYNQQLEKENACITEIKQAASDPALPVTAELVSTTEVSKNLTEINFVFKQNGKVIGNLTANGSTKGAKQDDAEYDYSSGIFDLDGAAPLNYTITNANGCSVADYFATEKTLTTLKDRVAVKSSDVKKTTKADVKSRLDFVRAIGAYLVAKRYM